MEQDAVLELFDCYADMVYRVALSWLRSPQEAEDVVQSIFLKLLEGGMTVYSGKERAFLTKITINHCKNILSAARSHETVPLDETVLFTQPEDRELFHAVMELPEKYRTVVCLHYFEGYSFREIAQLLHTGTSAVSMRLHRARSILKKQIGGGLKLERNLKRISDELKLPQESRERIRSHLASCRTQKEDIPMRNTTLKKRIPLLAAAIVIVMALSLTAAATVADLFRNDIIVSSREDAFSDASGSGSSDAPGAVAITGPNGSPPSPLEEIAESGRFKSDDWETGERIGGGVLPDYTEWDSAEVLSSEPSLRIRRVSRADGAEKMEYTAENPANLLDTLTGRVTFDLSWLASHYDYVPDANQAFVVTDAEGGYVSECFSALYAKPDGSGYVRLDVDNIAQADYWGQSYIVDGSYETAYYYTSSDGYEFLITMHNGRVWADCNTHHASISLYGAYLTSGEVEEILDSLSLSAGG